MSRKKSLDSFLTDLPKSNQAKINQYLHDTHELFRTMIKEEDIYYCDAALIAFSGLHLVLTGSGVSKESLDYQTCNCIEFLRDFVEWKGEESS